MTTESPPRAGPRRRGEQGLASHQWLLLIAAAASFTALAVFVLAETVDRAVDRAGEDEAAQRAAARRAGALIENEAVTILPGERLMSLWGDWEDLFTRRCKDIAKAHRARGVTVDAVFKRPKGTPPKRAMIVPNSGDPRFAAGVAEALARADRDPPELGKPQVSCKVKYS